jgi:ABC-type transport system involved in multi-copper enzyme maturation permease subunit
MLGLCIVPLAIFLGTGAAAGERSRGTFSFLQSLPIPMWQVSMHKLVAGLVTIVIPVMLIMALAHAGCWLLVQWEVLSPVVFSSRGAGLRTEIGCPTLI